MDLVPFYEPGRDSQSPSSAPAGTGVGPVERLLGQAMNASELVFFLGAPLAHVVDYENRLRANRCEKVVREVARSCRALHLHAECVADQPGYANDA